MEMGVIRSRNLWFMFLSLCAFSFMANQTCAGGIIRPTTTLERYDMISLVQTDDSSVLVHDESLQIGAPNFWIFDFTYSKGFGTGFLQDAEIQFDLSRISIDYLKTNRVMLRLFVGYSSLNEQTSDYFSAPLILSGFSGSGGIDLSDFHAPMSLLEYTYLPLFDDTANPYSVDFDVTDFVSNLKHVGARYAGFYLQTENDVSLGPGAIGFTGSGLILPQLASVPEPASLLMGATAVVVVALGMRSRGATGPGSGRRW